jgi:tripartite-type tricarboxylate transporter receptor subunit TctC
MFASFGRSIALSLSVAMGFSGFCVGSLAQGYPQRSVELIVPSSPGAPIDVMARAIAPAMAASLHQPVIVQNMAGAGGVLGATKIARGSKDGYTIGVAASNIAIIPALYKLPYDAAHDIKAVAMLAEGQMILAANASLPAQDVPSLLKLAASRPGGKELTFGSQGIGSIAHLEFELFKSDTRSNFLHVPYKGSDGMYTALSAGEIDVALLGLSAAIPLAKSGRVRLLGVLGDERVPSLPELKTLQEQGVRGPKGSSWIALFAPAGVDDTVLDRLHSEAEHALQDPTTRSALQNLGYQFSSKSRAEAEALYLSELQRYSAIVSEQNIKAAE